MRIFVLVFGCVALFAPSAQANVDAYCEAYAIDFANLAETDDVQWPSRRDDARAACLLQYRDAPVAIKAKPKRVKPAEVAKKTAVEQKAVEVEAPAPAKTSDAKPDIKEGTPAWYDYCARKYTSFSRKTGKYMSKTGVERKCLVTADFQ